MAFAPFLTVRVFLFATLRLGLTPSLAIDRALKLLGLALKFALLLGELFVQSPTLFVALGIRSVGTGLLLGLLLGLLGLLEVLLLILLESLEPLELVSELFELLILLLDALDLVLPTQDPSDTREVLLGDELLL